MVCLCNVWRLTRSVFPPGCSLNWMLWRRPKIGNPMCQRWRLLSSRTCPSARCLTRLRSCLVCVNAGYSLHSSVWSLSLLSCCVSTLGCNMPTLELLLELFSWESPMSGSQSRSRKQKKAYTLFPPILSPNQQSPPQVIVAFYCSHCRYVFSVSKKLSAENFESNHRWIPQPSHHLHSFPPIKFTFPIKVCIRKMFHCRL